MRKILFCCVLFALSLGLAAQAESSINSTLTPKEQALQLLDSLDQNNNDQQILIEQSQTELQIQLANSEKLKDSLKKTASYSERLEKSLMLSQTINKIAIPAAVLAIAGIVIIAVIPRK